jgi:hypothetical protein
MCNGLGTGRIGVHISCPEEGKKVSGDDLLEGVQGVYGGRRRSWHCFFQSSDGFIGAVPLSPPNFSETILLGES